MGKGKKIGKTLMTGLKAIVGGMAHYVVMLIILVFVSLIVGGLVNVGPLLMAFLVLIMLLVGIFVLGWIYNRLWGWK